MDEALRVTDRIRAEVELAIEIWRDLLVEVLGAGIVRLYAKGSAVRPWDSPLDYVPVLGDVDLHIETTLAHGLVAAPEEAFSRALLLSTEHEARFRRRAPDALHVPRAQLVVLNDQLGDPAFVHSPHPGLRALVGDLPAATGQDEDVLRALDRRRLHELKPAIDAIPDALADRSSVDLWTLVRRLGWRVSPSPVRVLSQRADDPYEVWTWNRTRVLTELEAAGHGAIAAPYRAWYETGWRLFFDGWQDGGLMRELVVHGHDALTACLEAVDDA